MSNLSQFKQAVEKEIPKWGLQGWETYFDIGELDDEVLVTVAWDLEARTSTIVLSSDKGINIKKATRYAVLHLFFAKITALACERFVTEAEINEEIHALIRTLEARYG